MSPRRTDPLSSPAVVAELRRASVNFGDAVRQARLARGWTVADLAARARLSRDLIYRIEMGAPVSGDASARVAVALGRRLEIELIDPRRRSGTRTDRELATDLVHSAMGELEARHLRGRGFGVGIDEPYQHYQFAGRADVVAWDRERRALLHIENRTRFPDFQDMAGAYNAKRAYLARSIAERVGVPGWTSETHVFAALWSSEVLHALRMRPDSFRSICPDGAGAFEDWWTGDPPRSGSSSSLVVLDPVATGRERAFAAFEDVGRLRPRHRGYADLAARLADAA